MSWLASFLEPHRRGAHRATSGTILIDGREWVCVCINGLQACIFEVSQDCLRGLQEARPLSNERRRGQVEAVAALKGGGGEDNRL
jgi:hypothetical protein